MHFNTGYCLRKLSIMISTPPIGERGGSVVERLTTEPEVWVYETYLRRVVSLSKTLFSPKVLVTPRKRWLCPTTEKMLTGTSSLNTNTGFCIGRDRKTRRQVFLRRGSIITHLYVNTPMQYTAIFTFAQPNLVQKHNTSADSVEY